MLEYRDLSKDKEIRKLTKFEINGKSYDPLSSPQKKILIIGNGFDQRANLASSFSDFIRFIVYFCALFNYKKSPVLCSIDFKKVKKYVNTSECRFQLKLALNNLENVGIQEKIFSFVDSRLGFLLLRKIFPFCFNVIIPNRFSELFKKNQSLLSEDEKYQKFFAKNFYGVEQFADNLYGFYDRYKKEEMSKNIETFLYIVDRDLDDSKVKLWLDIESVIEMIATNSPYLRDKYGFSEEIDKKKESNDSYLLGLQLFEELLSFYLKAVEDGCKLDKASSFFKQLSSDYNNSLAKRSNFLINSVDIRYADVVINYNYTGVAETLFKQINQNIDIRYINGSLNIEERLKNKDVNTNIVIGYSNLKHEPVSKEQYPFEKKSRRILKNTEYVDIESIIDKKLFDLVIFGHSCGEADGDVLKPLLESDYLHNAIILCHSKDDLLSIFNNIKAIVDAEIFNILFSHSAKDIRRNIFFSVEKG